MTVITADSRPRTQNWQPVAGGTWFTNVGARQNRQAGQVAPEKKKSPPAPAHLGGRVHALKVDPNAEPWKVEPQFVRD